MKRCEKSGFLIHFSESPGHRNAYFRTVRICVEHTRRDSNILEILPPEQDPLFLAWATMQDPSCPAIHVEHASRSLVGLRRDGKLPQNGQL